MKKKSVAAILSLGMLCSTIVGCGNNTGEENTSANSDEEKITITYMQWQQEFQTAAISLANAYMEENPNVTIEVITDASGYFENLKATLASGDVPEIFVTEGYNNMKAYEEYITDLSDQEWTENIIDEAQNCVTLDGKVMGMPITMAGEGIVYNKKMFEEHGWEIPKTVTELKELCEEIEAEGITPFTNEFADDWLLGQFMSAGGYAYIPNVDDYTDKLYAGEEKLVNNEQMKNTFQLLDLMLEYGQDDPMSYGWNETCSSFAMGESAMAFEGDWIWDTVYPVNPEIDCGIFALPATDNPEDTKLIVDANACFHVGKGSEHPEEAKKFLNWIATNETAKKIMLEEYKVIPVFDGWEYSADNKLAESTIGYLESGETYPWSWPTWPDGFRPAAGKVYQEYISGNVDATQALQEMDNLWENLTSSIES